MTGEKLSSIRVPNMKLVYKSVYSSSRRRVDGVKGVEGEIDILASCVFHY